MSSFDIAPLKITMEESHVRYQTFPEENQHSPKFKFPAIKEVLWNRTPLSNPASINFSGPLEKWSFIIDQRTLKLAYKQLQLHGNNFMGFFIGDIMSQNNGPLLIHVDRFDPGRDGQITIEGTSKNVRIPTSILPGNLCIPVNLCHRLAYKDQETTQSHSVLDFEKSILSIKSWFSRKEKLDVSNLVSMKMKCYFHTEENDIIAFISCSCITSADIFSVQSIKSIPIIQTALARNLCGTLGDKYLRVQTGFITMDQTRKLLLLVETDPKVYSLPLVGVWLSGVTSFTDHMVFGSLLRFIYSKEIVERVSVPKCSYLLVLFASHSNEPKFFEFSQENNVNGFQLMNFCEGVQIELHEHTADSEFQFDLKSSKSGLDLQNLLKALSNFNSVITEESVVGKLHQSNQLDDSIPFSSPIPHTLEIQRSITPSVPDLSLCDSSLIDDKKKDTLDIHVTTSETQSTCNKSLIDKKTSIFPRQTKASLARINMNKHPKIDDKMASDKKPNLAIKFKNKETKKNEIKDFSEQKYKIFEVDPSVLQSDPESSAKLPVPFHPLNNTPYTGKAIEYTSKNYVNLADDKSFIFDDKNKSFAESDILISKNSDDRDMDCLSVNNLNSDHRSYKDIKIQNNIAPISSEKYFSSSDNKKDLINNHHDDFKQKDPDNGLLLELVIAQQKQLADLQSQLNLFLNHEKSQETAKKNDAEDAIKAVQLKQQEQLDDLQKKLQLFLETTPLKSPSTIENIGIQCNMISPEKISTATNTGNSLVFERTPSVSDKKKSICQSCHHCTRKQKLRNQNSLNGKSNSSLNNDSVFSSPDLSELKKDDIQVALNGTTTSAETLASSLHAVDLPVFDDGQDTCITPNIHNSDEWNRSPMLGESASMLFEEKEKVNAAKNQAVDEIKKERESYNHHFYSQMMDQVQQMMNAQNISVSTSNSSPDDTPKKSKQNKVISSSKVDMVKLATETHLNKIINQPYELRLRSLSTGLVHNHPKINYLSMSVDETLNESQTDIDVIAAKYFPVTDLRTELRNKTVTFEGVVESNTTSVNFSCNMSIASKKYLQRYQLNEEENIGLLNRPLNKPLIDTNEIVHKEQKKARCAGKENILDMKKIRNLPKLL